MMLQCFFKATILPVELNFNLITAGEMIHVSFGALFLSLKGYLLRLLTLHGLYVSCSSYCIYSFCARLVAIAALTSLARAICFLLWLLWLFILFEASCYLTHEKSAFPLLIIWTATVPNRCFSFTLHHFV